MEGYNELIGISALVMGASWASGINLYATILVLGFASINGYIDLPQNLQLLADPIVLGAAGVMYLVEFFADKIPGFDSFWDSVHTFVRIPAGALIASGLIDPSSGPAVEVAAAILGGSLAAATHAAKSGSRVMINTSPEPFSNWGASILEDVAVFGGLWLAFTQPFIFFGFLVLFLVMLIWLLPKIIFSIRKIFSFLFPKEQNLLK